MLANSAVARCERGDARRAVVERAGLGLGERNELGEIARGQAGIEHQHVGLAADHAHRSEVLDRIVGQVGAETRGDRVRARGGDADGVAVGHRLGDGVGADTARAGAVLDHDLLADARAELLRDDARDDVRAAAGGTAR